MIFSRDFPQKKTLFRRFWKFHFLRKFPRDPAMVDIAKRCQHPISKKHKPSKRGTCKTCDVGAVVSSEDINPRSKKACLTAHNFNNTHFTSELRMDPDKKNRNSAPAFSWLLSTNSSLTFFSLMQLVVKHCFGRAVICSCFAGGCFCCYARGQAVAETALCCWFCYQCRVMLSLLT